MSITTTSNLSPMILQSLAPSILYTPTPSCNYRAIADSVSMPAHGGTTIRFMRPRLLQPATVQLGNQGIDPPSQVPQRDLIDATVSFYGTSCVLNEQILLQNQESVLAWVSDKLAVAMRQGEDIILRDFVVSSASRIYAGGGSNGDNPSNLGVSDFSLVAATLDSNNAFKFTEGLLGEMKIGSVPIKSAYMMLSSTELQPDFDALQGQGFSSVWSYSSNVSTMPTEYGSVLNVRILTSSQAPVARGASKNGRDVFYNFVCGKQAVTHVSQDQYSTKLIYRDPMYSGALAMNATLGIKFAQGQAMTQDTAARMLVSTSAYDPQIV